MATNNDDSNNDDHDDDDDDFSTWRRALNANMFHLSYGNGNFRVYFVYNIECMEKYINVSKYFGDCLYECFGLD